MFPAPVLAHMLGQQSFFKMNDVYTSLYHVPSTSLENFVLPQDSAPQKYLINEEISFEIDTTKLPMMSNATLATTQFQWNFGDGQQFEGLKTTHAYTRMGSYILQIYADDGSGTSPILLQSLLVIIIPDKAYRLPKAIIRINDVLSKDSLTDPLSFSFANPLFFDGSKSTSPVPITSFQWDFGDMNTAGEKSIRHTYKDDLRIVFPVLRIKNKDGFISDTFVQINNSLYDSAVTTKKNNSQGRIQTLIKDYGILFLTIGILTIGTVILLFRINKL